MKTRFFILTGLIAMVLTACDLNSSSNYTPQINFYTSHINKTDTLYIYPTDVGGVVRLDTIQAGDTIVFRMYLTGFTNNLTNFSMTLSDTTVAKILLPVGISMDSIFSKTQSDYAKGNFIFLPKKVNVYFPVRFIAKKPSTTTYLNLLLISDAIFQNSAGDNSVSYKLMTPIIAKRDSIK
jgi:hypothetical protein